MRRNTVTLLKYVIFAGLFVLVGPMLLKVLLAGSKASDRYVRSQVGVGLPQDPDAHDQVQHNMGDVLNFDQHQRKDDLGVAADAIRQPPLDLPIIKDIAPQV